MARKDERGRIVNTPALAVSLANWLAQVSGADWYSRHTLRVLAIIACYLGVSLQKSWELARDAALEVATRYRWPGVRNPASGLLYPVEPARRRRIRFNQLPVIVEQLQLGRKLSEIVSFEVEHDTTFISQSDSPTVTHFGEKRTLGDATFGNALVELAAQPPSASPAVERQSLHPLQQAVRSEEKMRQFLKFQKRLMQEQGYYQSEFELLRDVVDTLHETTYLQRILVARVWVTEARLKVYYSRGLEQFAALQRLELSLQGMGFFQRMLRKPQGLLVTSATDLAEYGPVPGVFRQAIEVDCFALHGIHTPKGPFALLYADRGVGGVDSVNAKDYEVLRVLALACTRYLLNSDRQARPFR
jgi:hypothetical protein